MRIQLVIPSSHAAKLLEAAKQSLNGVSLGVAGRVVGPRRTAFSAGRSYGVRAANSQGVHERVGIIAAVGNQVGWGQAVEQWQRLWGVVALTRRQATAQKSALGIGHHVHLARQTTAAAAQGLRPVFLRAPLAC